MFILTRETAIYKTVILNAMAVHKHIPSSCMYCCTCI